MPRKFPTIRSKVRASNISGKQKEFIGAISEAYSIRAPTSRETFYTVPNTPNEILVNIEVMRAELTFPLEPFAIAYFNVFYLTPIQLTPNSWVYLLGLAKYPRQILKVMPNIVLFRSMFTIAIKENSNLTYTFFGTNIKANAKFKG